MRIAIIGGGPAGLSTAIRLCKLGYTVSLMEAGDYTETRAGEHLGAEGKVILQQLGFTSEAWEAHSIPCIRVDGSWGSPDLMAKDSIFNPYGNGLILTRPAFDQSMADYAQSIGVNLYINCRVQKIQQQNDHWKIESSKEIFEVDFVVDASGRNSKFFRTFGAQRMVEDSLIGISRLLGESRSKTPPENEHSHLMVESCPQGWWYSVQLASGQLVATFMTDADVLTASGLDQENFWLQNLEASHYTQERCQGFDTHGKIFTQSAKSQQLFPKYGNNWLAVGDAAMSFDPLSSAGIESGLKMGIDAAYKIDHYAKGNLKAFEPYEQQWKEVYTRYLNNREAYYAMEGRYMNQLFWFKRSVDPKKIQDFTVLPNHTLRRLEGIHDHKITYLSNLFPQIDLPLLLQCIGKENMAHLALQCYMQKRQESMIQMEHFQAIESLKLLGVLEDLEGPGIA